MSVHVAYCKEDKSYQIVKIVIFGSFEAPPPRFGFDDAILLRSYVELWIMRTLGLPSLKFCYNCIVSDNPLNDRQKTADGPQTAAGGAINTTKDSQIALEETYRVDRIDGQNDDS